LFDVSRTKANNTFNYWVGILREISPVSQIEEAKKMSKNINNSAKNINNYAKD
jgi:hypothetical protein